MSWVCAEEGRDDLKGAEYIEKDLSIKNFKTVDLLSGFVMGNGGKSARRFLKHGFRSKKNGFSMEKPKRLQKPKRPSITILASRNIRLAGTILFRII